MMDPELLRDLVLQRQHEMRRTAERRRRLMEAARAHGGTVRRVRAALRLRPRTAS
jgi:hypothetical protein